MTNMLSTANTEDEQIKRGSDLFRLRRMLGLNQSSFAIMIGRSVTIVRDAERSSVLPRDIQMVAQSVLEKHLKKVRGGEEAATTVQQSVAPSGIDQLSPVASQHLKNEIEKMLSSPAVIDALAQIVADTVTSEEIIMPDRSHRSR